MKKERPSSTNGYGRKRDVCTETMAEKYPRTEDIESLMQSRHEAPLKILTIVKDDAGFNLSGSHNAHCGGWHHVHRHSKHFR